MSPRLQIGDMEHPKDETLVKRGKVMPRARDARIEAGREQTHDGLVRVIPLRFDTNRFCFDVDPFTILPSGRIINK